MRTSLKTSLTTTQDSSLRHASETGKPQQDSSPRGGKNAAPHHPRKVPNVTFWSPKRRSYTAKATTRRRWEQASKQASKPRKIALWGMHPKQGNPSRIQAQGVAKTQRHTTHEKCLTSLSEALKEEVTPPRQRPGQDENKPQKNANASDQEKMRMRTSLKTTQKHSPSVTSLARSPWNDGVGGYSCCFSL